MVSPINWIVVAPSICRWLVSENVWQRRRAQTAKHNNAQKSSYEFRISYCLHGCLRRLINNTLCRRNSSIPNETCCSGAWYFVSSVQMYSNVSMRARYLFCLLHDGGRLRSSRYWLCSMTMTMRVKLTTGAQTVAPDSILCTSICRRILQTCGLQFTNHPSFVYVIGVWGVMFEYIAALNSSICITYASHASMHDQPPGPPVTHYTKRQRWKSLGNYIFSQTVSGSFRFFPTTPLGRWSSHCRVVISILLKLVGCVFYYISSLLAPMAR